ncbi:MAG TPA: cytochrome c oxidase subunit 3 [Bacteroidia bacterium]|nr:cytochrome c oxidase subunit 3 [Bacteroidia bacterium]
MEKINIKNNIYYPPGGILLWIIIFLELLTFGMAIIAFLISSKSEFSLFHESRLQLNITLGSCNTIILISSGYYMAKAVNYFKENDSKRFSSSLHLTMLIGSLFIVLKSIEYYYKIKNNLLIDTNTFFTFYWLLTIFHLIHVIVGMIILIVIRYKTKQQPNIITIDDVEAAGAFWHMCDLIWLLIFPLLYLYN